MVDPITTLQTASTVANSVGQLSDSLLNVIPKVIALSAMVSAILPPVDQPGVWSAIHKIINLLGCNFLNAKNQGKT